jgi:predicted nucleotidyltransferase
MKNIEEIKNIIQKEKAMLIEKHKIKEIGIFGSYVRGEQNHNSDIDILVSFEEFPGLIEFIDIENKLSEELGIKVDLVTKSGLKPEIGRHILREALWL